MKINWKRPRWEIAIPIAIALGLLESAWTGYGADGAYRGVPTNTLLGVVAIFIVFGLTTFPKPWRIGALAILEEITHWIAGYGAWPPLPVILNHWSYSEGFLPVNLYPYILLPLLTVIGEVVFAMVSRRKRKE